jgi:hypothetical protein
MGDRTADQRDQPALAEGIDAEAGRVGDFEGEVDLVLVRELLELELVVEQRAQRPLGVLGAQDGGAGVERKLAGMTSNMRPDRQQEPKS